MQINNIDIVSGFTNQKNTDKKTETSFSQVLTNGMTEKEFIGDNSYQGGGWAYVDKYGFSHVVSDFKTAQEYKMSSTKVYQYNGKYGGGYALGDSGERQRLGLEKEIPYGNEDKLEKANPFADKKYLGLSVDPYKYIKILESQNDYLDNE